MRKRVLSLLAILAFALPCFGQAWSGILASPNAADWSTAGLPGDIPPDIANSWTQCGSTIAAYGSSGTPGNPSTINSAISSCGTNHYVLLGSGDFWLSGSITLVSNVVLRGAGPNLTKLHFPNSAFNTCNGWGGNICIVGPNMYTSAAGGGCETYFQGNVTGGLSQGSTSLTVSFPGWVASQTTDACAQIIDSNGAMETETNAGPCTLGSGSHPTWPGPGGSVSDGTCAWHNVGTLVMPTTNLTPFWMDQCETGYTGATTGSIDCAGSQSDNGNIYVCEVTGTGGCSSQGGNTGIHRVNRPQVEALIATAISGSGAGPYTIMLAKPIAAPNWATGSGPQIFWPATGTVITNAGVENLLIDSTTSGNSSVVISTAYKCWAYRIASDLSTNYHVFNIFTSRILVAQGYYYGTDNSVSQSYGVGGAMSSDDLIESNIMQQIADPVNFDASCVRCVVGYNFARDNYVAFAGYMFGFEAFHAAGEMYILTEGNVANQVDSDDIWGGHDMNTFYRNVLKGYELNSYETTGTDPGCSPVIPGTSFCMPSKNSEPAHPAAYSRYMNWVGNVLGSPGFQTSCYQNPAPTQTTTNGTCFNIDVWDIGWSGNTHNLIAVSGSYNDAPTTLNTLMRWGNYDVVTAAVRWCGNSSDTGWSATCGSTSEIPTGDSYYPTSVPSKGDTGAGQGVMPPSFYTGVSSPHSSCGTGLSFWKNPTTGACPPYPNAGPDVSAGSLVMCTGGIYEWSLVLSSAQCSGGSSSAYPSEAAANPAMICALNQMSMPSDGTGSMLTFNPSACYEADPASGTVAPGPAQINMVKNAPARTKGGNHVGFLEAALR